MKTVALAARERISQPALQLNSIPKKIFRSNFRLLQNRPKGPLWNVAGMVWQYGIKIAFRMKPQLMAAGRLSIKSKSKTAQPPDHISIPEAVQPPHLLGSHNNSKILALKR